MVEKEDQVSLRKVILEIRVWIHYLISKWLIIIVLGIFGAAIGLILSLTGKTVYTAVTTFVLGEGNAGGPLGQYAGMASLAGIDLGGGGGGLFQGDNIIELYKSRTMLQKTLLTKVEFDGKQQLLIDRYLEFTKTRVDWEDKPKLKGLSFDNPEKFGFLQDSVIGQVVKRIRQDNVTVAKLDKKLNILKVEVNSFDEQFAKLFNDELVKAVSEFYIKTKTKNSLQNVHVLQHQTDSVQAVLNGVVYSSARTMDATPNLNPTKQILRAPIQRSQLTVEANKLMLGELLKNLELAKISLRNETPLIQVVDQPIYPLSIDRLSKTKGVITGGIVAGFIAIIGLIVVRFFTKIINET